MAGIRVGEWFRFVRFALLFALLFLFLFISINISTYNYITILFNNVNYCCLVLRKMSGNNTKSEIINLLTERDYGLTIEEIAVALKTSRTTASKYLAILEAEKKIRVREVGKAKLHYPRSKNIIG